MTTIGLSLLQVDTAQIDWTQLDLSAATITSEVPIAAGEPVPSRGTSPEDNLPQEPESLIQDTIAEPTAHPLSDLSPLSDLPSGTPPSATALEASGESPAADFPAATSEEFKASNIKALETPAFPPVPFHPDPVPLHPPIPPTIIADSEIPAPTQITGTANSNNETALPPSDLGSEPDPASPDRSPSGFSRFLLVSRTVWILLIGAGAVGIGLIGIATIAFLANLANPRPRASTDFAAFPEFQALTCNEPPIPARLPNPPDYVFPDGTRYYGAMAEQQPADGRGILVFPSGNRYDGEFRDGQRNGCGTQTNANGRQYIGEFQADQFQGQGMWILENGDRYIGTFRDNRCHGEGVFVFADGRSQRGIWQDGNLVGEELSCTPL
ncbi:MORN repeat-containing protein [Egbenema bharatensis]|uniref:MORN repeat-containing protein n=1 Tax=Egbenema bharatensis TaxID=3463334 RepID=UPI003A8BAF56